MTDVARSGYATVVDAFASVVTVVLSTIFVKYFTSAKRTTAVSFFTSRDTHRNVRA